NSSAENAPGYTVSGPYIFDNTAPTVTVGADKTMYKQGDIAVITATFSEPVQDMTPQIALSGVGMSTPTVPMTKVSETVYTYSYIVPSGDGTESITISGAADAAGNVMVNNSTQTFIIDNTKPTINVGVAPLSDPCKSTSVTITAADPAAGSVASGLSGTNAYEYQLSTSNMAAPTGSWTPYTSGTPFTIGTGMDGTYYLWVKAVNDNAGNTSVGAATPAARTIRI
ncbi:MAG: Ig-like domain-containing protein, partial [Firmicutes bacterium]|nr:Ig-like domain-containing protein [Bacillota bacterium]